MSAQDIYSIKERKQYAKEQFPNKKERKQNWNEKEWGRLVATGEIKGDMCLICQKKILGDERCLVRNMVAHCHGKKHKSFVKKGGNNGKGGQAGSNATISTPNMDGNSSVPVPQSVFHGQGTTSVPERNEKSGIAMLHPKTEDERQGAYSIPVPASNTWNNNPGIAMPHSNSWNNNPGITMPHSKTTDEQDAYSIPVPSSNTWNNNPGIAMPHSKSWNNNPGIAMPHSKTTDERQDAYSIPVPSSNTWNNNTGIAMPHSKIGNGQQCVSLISGQTSLGISSEVKSCLTSQYGQTTFNNSNKREFDHPELGQMYSDEEISKKKCFVCKCNFKGGAATRDMLDHGRSSKHQSMEQLTLRGEINGKNCLVCKKNIGGRGTGHIIAHCEMTPKHEQFRQSIAVAKTEL